jgi:hypothetical protein
MFRRLAMQRRRRESARPLTHMVCVGLRGLSCNMDRSSLRWPPGRRWGANGRLWQLRAGDAAPRAYVAQKPGPKAPGLWQGFGRASRRPRSTWAGQRRTDGGRDGHMTGQTLSACPETRVPSALIDRDTARLDRQMRRLARRLPGWTARSLGWLGRPSSRWCARPGRGPSARGRPPQPPAVPRDLDGSARLVAAGAGLAFPETSHRADDDLGGAPLDHVEPTSASQPSLIRQGLRSQTAAAPKSEVRPYHRS